MKFDVKNLSKKQQIAVLLGALAALVALFALTFAACSSSVMRAVDEKAGVSAETLQEETAVPPSASQAEAPQVSESAIDRGQNTESVSDKGKGGNDSAALRAEDAQKASEKDSQKPSNSASSKPKEKEKATSKPAASTPAPAATPAKLADTTPKTITVTIAIDCKTAYAKDPDAVEGLSSAGVILGAKKLTLPEGANVKQALEASGVRFNARGAYISGIGGLSEGDLGPKSGWLYSVNGTFPSASCVNYKLSAGDSVAWRYTCNQGEDVGSPR